MLGGPFPPLPDPWVIQRRMVRLAAQASLAVHKQHLVSGVLLGQFAAPIGQRGAPQVYSFNLEYPAARLKGRGLETCGEAPIADFVKFASQSLEQVWWRVENEADTTFAAVRSGSALQPTHLDRLRDLIAVHHARSIQYYAVFEDSLLRAGQQARRFWEQLPEVLDAIAVSRLGLLGGDLGSRERAVQELRLQPYLGEGSRRQGDRPPSDHLPGGSSAALRHSSFRGRAALRPLCDRDTQVPDRRTRQC